jgi:peroxiredoxin
MTDFSVGDTFPDFMLPDHDGSPKTLSVYTEPGQLDEKMGFLDGYPIVLIFSRGFFCPRDQEQMRQLVGFQDELNVNYCKLAVVNADPPMVSAAFRAGLGARFPFLSDEHRTRPFTFVLRPDLTVFRIYDGWFFVGRPTIEELRHDLRAIMEGSPNYSYEAFDTPEAKSIRIPQQSGWKAPRHSAQTASPSQAVS